MFLSKKETFLKMVAVCSLVSTLGSEEITLGILIGIRDNSSLTLNDQNTQVECSPFGIQTLETMKKEAGSSECSKSIEAFYLSHPHQKSFAKEHLHLYQRYHYEKRPYGCVLYSNGAESYSEQLLNEGLAIIDPKFNETEWNTKLRRAEKRGKVLKKGMYEGEVAIQCVKGENTP